MTKLYLARLSQPGRARSHQFKMTGLPWQNYVRKSLLSSRKERKGKERAVEATSRPSLLPTPWHLSVYANAGVPSLQSDWWIPKPRHLPAACHSANHGTATGTSKAEAIITGTPHQHYLLRPKRISPSTSVANLGGLPPLFGDALLRDILLPPQEHYQTPPWPHSSTCSEGIVLKPKKALIQYPTGPLEPLTPKLLRPKTEKGPNRQSSLQSAETMAGKPAVGQSRSFGGHRLKILGGNGQLRSHQDRNLF